MGKHSYPDLEVMNQDCTGHMLKVAGKHFRCHCGANVMTCGKYDGQKIFRCNGCSELYLDE